MLPLVAPIMALNALDKATDRKASKAVVGLAGDLVSKARHSKKESKEAKPSKKELKEAKLNKKEQKEAKQSVKDKKKDKSKAKDKGKAPAATPAPMPSRDTSLHKVANKSEATRQVQRQPQDQGRPSDQYPQRLESLQPSQSRQQVGSKSERRLPGNSDSQGSQQHQPQAQAQSHSLHVPTSRTSLFHKKSQNLQHEQTRTPPASAQPVQPEAHADVQRAPTRKGFFGKSRQPKQAPAPSSSSPQGVDERAVPRDTSGHNDQHALQQGQSQGRTGVPSLQQVGRDQHAPPGNPPPQSFHNQQPSAHRLGDEHHLPIQTEAAGQSKLSKHGQWIKSNAKGLVDKAEEKRAKEAKRRMEKDAKKHEEKKMREEVPTEKRPSNISLPSWKKKTGQNDHVEPAPPQALPRPHECPSMTPEVARMSPPPPPKQNEDAGMSTKLGSLAKKSKKGSPAPPVKIELVMEEAPLTSDEEDISSSDEEELAAHVDEDFTSDDDSDAASEDEHHTLKQRQAAELLDTDDEEDEVSDEDEDSELDDEGIDDSDDEALGHHSDSEVTDSDGESLGPSDSEDSEDEEPVPEPVVAAPVPAKVSGKVKIKAQRST